MDTNQNQKVSCIANYVYEASEPDELSVKPGDVLRDVERLPGGWWRGELRGRRGMFPDNFVSVITEHGNTRSSVQGRCRAVFSYQPANPDELALNVGDVLDVLAEVEEGWWQGRRQGRVGVFPSNFVVMLDPPQTAPFEPAPALPPKPVKELCRVLFPYTAMNEDELTLSEGDIVTLVSKDAPDRGWWKGELHGRVGLFPDNFVELLPPVTHDLEREEKKPERPPSKTNVIYPILNKYSEKTASVKELTTSRISLHKENTVSKENSIQSTVTHTNKNESEKIVHTETVTDSTDGQIKKPPVPLKKSPTPTSGVSSLLSGLKNKMMPSSDKDKDKQAPLSHSSSGEWDRPDGLAASKPASRADTLDHVERNSMLQDPRAGRVKAPRRRPPSQVFRDDTPMTIGLSNGHEVPTEIPVEKEKEKEREKDKEKAEEIKPRAREWEKHRAPWMAELKLNQAKKTSFGSDGKSRSQSSSSEGGVACKAGSGSTDRILDCGLEEKRSSTHSMEMSKSTSSISTKMAVVENVESFEETKVRQSLDSKDSSRLSDPPVPATKPPQVQSPTAAGRTITTMLDEIRKPPAPTPPAASVRTSADFDKSPNKFRISADFDKSPNKTVISSERSDVNSFSKTSTSGVVEKSTTEMLEKTELKGTLERIRSDKSDGAETLIAQLSNRILNLEKLLEVQNAKFNAAIEDLTKKLNAETEKRLALQSEMEKLAHCVTQV